MIPAKLSLSILLSVLLLQLFLPWWIIAIVAFVLTWYFKTGKLLSFSAAFLTVFIVWALRAYWVDLGAEHTTATLIGNILGGLTPSLAIFLTALTGGIVAGISGLSGSMVRELINGRNPG